MSYNTSSIRFLDGTLTITKQKLKAFEKKMGWPIGDVVRCDGNHDGDPKTLRIRHILSGECTLNHDLPEFLMLTKGSADLLIVWEGGDTINGLRVVDGGVIKMDVEFLLVPEKEKRG